MSPCPASDIFSGLWEMHGRQEMLQKVLNLKMPNLDPNLNRKSVSNFCQRRTLVHTLMFLDLK